MKAWTWLLAAGLSLALLGTAGAGEATSPRVPNLAALAKLGPPRIDPKREWTLLWYMDADNDLERLGVQEFRNVETVLAARRDLEPRLEIIVLFDRARGGDTRDGDWTETRLYRMRPGQGRSELLANCGELNMGDPATLRTFLASAARAFPAKRYAVMLDDHGCGWTGCSWDHDAPGSPNGVDHLSLPEVQSALEGALWAIGRPRFDLLLFEMCLMAQLEVAVACKDTTDQLVFSQAIVWGSCMWEAFLESAFDHEKLDTRAIATRFVPLWSRHYREKISVATLSAADAVKVDNVAKGLNTVLRKMIPMAPQHWATICRALYHAQRFTASSGIEEEANALASIDLLDALARMRANIPGFPAEAEYQRLLAASKECILASFAGSEYRRSHGLAIYAPLYSKNYKRSEYAAQALSQLTSWPRFLETLHACQAKHQEKPRFHSTRIQDPQGQLTNIVTPLSGHWCYYALEADNILRIRLGTGTYSEGVGYVVWHRARQRAPRAPDEWKDVPEEELELRLPPFQSGKSILGQELPGVVFQLASGGRRVPATVEEMEREDRAVVRGFYSHPAEGNNIEAEVVFNMIRRTPVEVRALLPTAPGLPPIPKALTPRPDGLFRPNLDVLDPYGEPLRVPGSPIPWGEGPRLVMTPMPPGEQLLILDAETVSGQRATTVIPFKCRANAFIEQHLQKGPPLSPAMLKGQWQWQTPRRDPQTGRVEFRNLGVQVSFGPPHPDDPLAMDYSFLAVNKESRGVVYLEPRGLPTLTFCSKDARGYLRRGLTFVALFRPADGRPALFLKELGSAEPCQFLKEEPGR